ncbi:DEKNAAC101553 [Brettanomyces naardenensis]|uniref:DEKNAAC101553 n=1 Tax=Brettanomyces naardenensis TaxID=13370 RepID=A0A448YIN8_BRENA|nr:DEKNAAC101553 [Brettanomyces naardenensis]
MTKSRIRPRMLSACSICRKRKVKCDRTRPACRVCIRHNVAHLCNYGEPEWAKKEKPKKKGGKGDQLTLSDNKLNLLEDRIRQLEDEVEYYKNFSHDAASKDDSISFEPKVLRFDVETGCLNSPGTLSAVGIVQADPFFVAARKFLEAEKKIGSDFPYCSMNTVPLSSGRDSNSIDRETEQTFKDRVLRSLKEQCNKTVEATRTSWSQFFVPLPLGYDYIQPGLKQKMIAKLDSTMPTRRVTWMLIDRFFQYVYPFYPYIDEVSFRNRVKTVIGEGEEGTRITDGNGDSISLNEKCQILLDYDRSYITFGLLLLILHLGSLTLKSSLNTPYPKYDGRIEEVVQFLDHPLDKDIISISRLCVDKFQVLKHCNFDLLQYYIYLKVVTQCSPCIADPADFHQFSDLIRQMIMAMNLNKEVSCYKFVGKSFPMINLARKVWYGGISDAFFMQYLSECPFFRNTDYDVTLPTYGGENNSNCMDIGLEQASIYTICLRADFQRVYDLIYDKVMNLRLPPKVKKIASLQRRLEEMVTSKLTPLPEILSKPKVESPQEVAMRVIRFCVYLESHSVLLSLDYHFFLHYESHKQPQMAFNYLVRLLKLSLSLVYLSFHMIGRIPHYFGYGFDFLIAPKLLFTLDRVRQTFGGLILRIAHLRFHESRNCTLTDSMKQCTEELCDEVGFAYADMVATYGRVSHYYYHAWRKSKVESFKYRIFQFMEEKWLNPSAEATSVPDVSLNIMIKWKESQFRQLLEIFRECKRGDRSEKKDSPERVEGTGDFDTNDNDWIATLLDKGFNGTAVVDQDTSVPDLVNDVEWNDILSSIMEGQM